MICIGEKDDCHLSCVLILSCVISELIYGHLMGFIGAGMLSLYITLSQASPERANPDIRSILDESCNI